MSSKKKVYKLIKIYFKDAIHQVNHPLSAGSISPGGAVFPGNYILEYSEDERSVTLKPGWQINVTHEVTLLKFEDDLVLSVSNTKIKKIETIEREIFIKDAFPSPTLEDKIKLCFRVPVENIDRVDSFLDTTLRENKIIAWRGIGDCVLEITRKGSTTRIDAEDYEVLLLKDKAHVISRDLLENGLVPPGQEWTIFEIPVTALMVREFY